MLFNLCIENAALIEKADINFGDGFHVLTGETGAGKSILIGSLNMLLGERVGRDFIRNGKDYVYVEGLFYLSAQAQEMIKQFDIEPEEDGSVIVSRKLSKDGKNLCKVGGKTIPVSVLREIGRFLVNIHGQHDNQALLDPACHIDFLDAFLNETSENTMSLYKETYLKFKEAEKELENIEDDESERARKAELLEFEIKEIKDANILSGEEEELKKQRELAKNKETFLKNCSGALDVLYENQDNICVYNLLSDAERFLETAAELDNSLEEASDKLTEIRYLLEDVTSAVRDKLEITNDFFVPLEEIEERLDVIYRLKRKYGNSEEEILSYLEHAESAFLALQTADERKEELEKEKIRLFTEATRLAKENHDARVISAKEVEKKIKEELKELNMENAVFSIEILECPLNKYGMDNVEFLLSANKGEPLKPLSKIVSGGELSRIMLALKKVLTSGDLAETLIFDEIDTGISGKAAGKVGAKLCEISKKKQVLCVTHLPQIAALSDKHYKISKAEVDDKTVTTIEALDYETKKQEIALLIGGDHVTDITLAQAESMIKNI